MIAGKIFLVEDDVLVATVIRQSLNKEYFSCYHFI